MDKNRRKELLEAYKKIVVYAGVIRITNQKNGKVFVKAYVNLKNKWESIRAQLDAGRYMNLRLQAEWKEYGPEAFTYDILEQKDAQDITDVRWELGQMEKAWLSRLQPYGERGYHVEK